MKKITLVTSLSLLGTLLFAESAADWAIKNGEAVATINAASLAQLAQDATALDALIAETAKPAYSADALAVTRLAALTQYVVGPSGNAHVRKLWAEKLLTAAKSATDPYIALFFLDQLRWAGTVEQAPAIKALATSAGDKAVKEMAALTAATLEALPKAATADATKYSALRQAVLALPEAQRTARLLTAFDDPDIGIVGTALTLATQSGGGRETLAWAAKLRQSSDPIRKTMLIDMLGARGDNAAQGAVASALADSDNRVATAAHRAFARLNTAAYAAHLPTLLKTLPPEQIALVSESVRQLCTTLVQATLPQACKNFSPAGLIVAFELFRERRLPEAVPLALAAVDGKEPNGVIAAWRLLREVAGKEQSEQLIAKALTTTGRVTPEALAAIATAASRDTSGSYIAAITKTYAAATTSEHKALLLDAAARTGAPALLETVKSATTAPDAATATAAVRALAAWPNAAALPALFELAIGGADNRTQVLALRGAEKIAAADHAGTLAHLAAWQKIREKPGNEEHKKSIEELFKAPTKK